MISSGWVESNKLKNNVNELNLARHFTNNIPKNSSPSILSIAALGKIFKRIYWKIENYLFKNSRKQSDSMMIITDDKLLTRAILV